MVGDGLLAINGVDVDGRTSDEVAQLLDSTDQRPTTVLSVSRTIIAAETATLDRTGNSSGIAIANGVDLTGILGDIKEDWGSEGWKSPSGVQGRSPGKGSGGRNPPEAEAFL